MEINHRQSLFCTLRQIISEELDVTEDQIQPDSTWEKLGADSLDRLKMTFVIENTFTVEIPHTVGETLNTVGQTLDHLVTQMAPAEMAHGQDC